MDSFTKASQFTYNPNSNRESEEDAFSGILEIHVHRARNIHNICIYENQDVYAKFSLTYDPDETLSTRVVNGGGKNPQFDEDLIMKINQVDSVLKCEIWMMSRVKNYMDDQLLGFALVPISSLVGREKVTQDFDLSSTDLFHSPAGTIKLSLSLNAKNNPIKFSHSFADVDSSATSELLFDDKEETSEDYCRVEFPDINVVQENQDMVSQFFAENGGTLLRPWLEKPDGSFLSLGAAASVGPVDDCEMDSSPDGSVQNSGFMSSTITSMSDDRNSVDFSNDNNSTVGETPTSSKKKGRSEEENEPNFSMKEDESNKISDESVMQQQIVDMYMRSMQQFTESLAKMKLPMDLDKPSRGDDNGHDDGGDVTQNPEKKMEIEKNKDNSRVFYGSRAFF